MGRPPRITEPGLGYHVLNRRVIRLPLFRKDHDYLAFERRLAESGGVHRRLAFPIRVDMNAIAL